ncbi:TPA: hypothetical protein DCX16_03885 [bacterium]|nr:hypothetical protein [bacterium]
MKMLVFLIKLIIFIIPFLSYAAELYVASYPVIEAKLYINDKPFSETPANFPIKPGKYKLRAEKEGWVSEEKEVVISEEGDCVFVNIPMMMVVYIPQIEKPESKKEAVVVFPIEPPIELSVPEEVEEVEIETEPIPKPEPKEEVPKKEKPELKLKEESKKEIVFEKPVVDISLLILRGEALIEKAEEAGANRYASKRINLAKKLLKKAKKKNSSELALRAIKEAELALDETKEKISRYSSRYIMGIVKTIGK